MAGLTAKQQRFVDEYIIDMNATQAALRAGYSQKTARQVGSENLSKPYIADAISQKRGQLAEKTDITAERVVREVAVIAFGEDDNAVRIRALDLLGKHFGLWAETVVRREVVFVDLSGGDQRAREIIEGEYEAA